MKQLCEGYIKNAKLIGALYSIVPTVLWTVILLAMVPFRQVYLLRLALSVVVGGWMGAYFNELGLRLWLTKHRSAEGPGTVMDGAFIGAGIGMVATFFPPLTGLILTHHPEQAKLLIIGAWLGGFLIGGLTGGILAMIGREHMPRGGQTA